MPKGNSDKKKTMAGYPDVSYIAALCDLIEIKKIDRIDIGDISISKSRHVMLEEKQKAFDVVTDHDAKLAEVWLSTTKTE